MQQRAVIWILEAFHMLSTMEIEAIAGLIIITNTLHAAQKNFDSLLHLYQIQSVAIAKEL